MISKRLAFFLVILTAGGVYASYAIDRTRDVPRFPPGFTGMLGTGVAPAVVPPRPERPRPDGDVPRKPISDLPEPGALPEPPDLPSDGDEVRISTVNLQGLEVGYTDRVIDPGDSTFVVITITKEGRAYWGSLDTGSLQMVATMMERNAETEGFTAVVAPDREVPWKYVHWVLAAAREKGVENVKLAGFPDSDRSGTLLAALRAEVAEGATEGDLPEGMDEIAVEVAMDAEGKVSYSMFGEVAENATGVGNLASKMNGEYASFYGPDYSRKALLSPWVIRPEAEVPAGKVLRAMIGLRANAVYAFRVDGDYGDPPGK